MTAAYIRVSCHPRDLPFEEVHSNGLFIVLGEDTLAVALDHAGLSHGTVAHHDHLDGHFHVLLQHGCAAAAARVTLTSMEHLFTNVTHTHKTPESIKYNRV